MEEDIASFADAEAVKLAVLRLQTVGLKPEAEQGGREGDIADFGDVGAEYIAETLVLVDCDGAGWSVEMTKGETVLSVVHSNQ